jgi:colicin import membrane protein
MEVRPHHLLLAIAAHVAVALVLWITQLYHPLPKQLEVMEVVFVEPVPEPPRPTPAPPPPAPTPPPATPAPTPPPATPPPATPRPTPPPPDPAVELKKFVDAIALKLDCDNLDRLRAEAARGATPEQREAAGRLIQQKAADCAREAEERRREVELAEQRRREEEDRRRVEEEERRRREEEQRRREELQRQIEQERRERELAEQLAREAEMAARLAAEQEAINRGIVQRAGSRWAGQVAAAIRPNMLLPPETRSDLETTFFFRVLADGTIMELRQTRSSGNAAFDLAMERAIERTGRLPPIDEPLLAEEILRNGINIRLTPQR